MKFGWYPERKSVETCTIRISPLPEFSDAVESIVGSGLIIKDWIYPPLQHNRNQEDSIAAVAIPWFALPPTHSIEYLRGSEDSELLRFLVTIFGWLQGLRLVPEEWGHHYRVPSKRNQLTDFTVYDRDLVKCLNLAEAFWFTHRSSGIADKLFSAVHWYLYSCSYEHHFERFTGQYTVLDSCYAVFVALTDNPPTDRRHFRRVPFLCDELGMECPTWAAAIEHDGRATSELAIIRNELVHEAQWGGVAIGFGHPNSPRNIVVELEAFNCRLIAALLGASGRYTSSSSQTRQMHRLTID